MDAIDVELSSSLNGCKAKDIIASSGHDVRQLEVLWQEYKSNKCPSKPAPAVENVPYIKQYFHKENFPTINSPKPCSEDIQLLLAIKTRPGAMENRRILRRTWGNSTYYKGKHQFPCRYRKLHPANITGILSVSFSSI